MLRRNDGLVFAFVFGLLASPSFAFRSGPPSGRNGSTASGGATCRLCHGAAVGTGSVQILNAPTVYIANTVYNISVRVADPAKLGAGFQISVEDSGGVHRGTLINSTGFTQSNSGWVNHNNAGVNDSVSTWAGNGQSYTYNLQWQAPATNQGTLTFWAAGNAINNNFSSSGDTIYLTNVSATAAGGTGACCDDMFGDCTEGVTQLNCQLIGHRYGGDDSTCATINPPCIGPTGACCDDDTGNCIEPETQANCESGGYRYGGDDSTCANIDPPCVAPGTGACCDDARGDCIEGLTQVQCEEGGFRYGGDDSTCGTIDPPCEAPIAISLETFVSGLSSPVDLTHAGDNSYRIFIVDQIGKIWVWDNGNVLPDPFLDISAIIPPLNAFFDERGLLGLTFHPDYEFNGRFFIRYSKPRAGAPEEPCNDPGGFIVGCHEEILAEYHVTGNPVTNNVADPGSEIILYRADKPQFNHNSGQVAFGPDGYLYFTLGDGGGANDGLADVPPSHGPIGNGQNRFSKLGKMHRIDVDGAPNENWQNECAQGPGARIASAMVYDSCRNVTVLYSGTYNNGPRDEDTWEWDGLRWVLKATVGPTAQGTYGLAFDKARCETVLFGGGDGLGTYLNETWVWNGSVWTQKTTSNSPDARTGPAMTFNETLNLVVLFGGYHPGHRSDTWTWDGTDWTQLTTTAPPSARTNSALVFDPACDRSVLFGGTNAGNCSGPHLGDTWELDMSVSPATWTQIITGASPSARENTSLVFDSSLSPGTLILFGGLQDCSTMAGDTWAYSCSTSSWSQISTSVSPAPRWGQAMAFDQLHKKAVMFGGTVTTGVPLPSQVFSDTWTFGIPAYSVPAANPFMDSVNGCPSIYAYGLRNAFKFSFDDGPLGDGTLYLPDVGQNLYEEVNIGTNGANYGWVIREGAHCFDPVRSGDPAGKLPDHRCAGRAAGRSGHGIPARRRLHRRC